MRRVWLLTYLLILLAGAAGAAPSSAPVNLSADSLVLDQDSGLYLARGDVRIDQGELRLHADSAAWNQATGEAVCRGGVRLQSSDGTLTGDSLAYNFTTGLGLLRNGQAELASNSVFLSGETIEKKGEISYRITGGSFTTCPGETPAWKLTASRLDVDVDGYARARNAIFHLRNIPVLYLPYIALPAKTRRQSGLLFPEISHSDRLGERYLQPYYLVLDDHLDATLSVDYMSDFGIGSSLEFRYLFANSQPGRIYGNYIAGFDREPDRGLYQWSHDGYLPGHIRLVVDGEYLSRKDYYRIFGGQADIYTREKSQSTLWLSRAWGKTVVAAKGQYTRDLLQSSADLLQYLPEVRFDYLPQRVGRSPLLLAMFGEASYLWQRQGLKGGRLRLQPALSTDLLVGRYLEVVPQVSWLQRDYRIDDNHEGEGIPVATLSVGSRFARVFRPGGKSLTHLRHAVEPAVRYSYIPDVDQAGLPDLDSFDRVEALNLITFELTNRLTGRWQRHADQAPTYRELASVSLAVDYDVSEARRTLGPFPDKRRPFSPIRGELIVRPTRSSFLRGDIAYDANDGAREVERWSAWGGMQDRRGNGLLVNYNYRRSDYDYLSGGVDLALLEPLYLSYEQRYDVETSLKLEEIAQLELRGRCWNILVSYSDRLEEEKVSFEFSLSGLSDNRLVRSVASSLKNFF